MPEYWPANKLIGILEHVLVEAKDIIGQLTSDQIKDLAAEKITGQLADEQLKEIAAAKVAGQLTNAQIKELEAAKISGQLVDAQIKEMTAGKIKGLLSASQIESLEATKITGQLTSEQIKELEAAKISGQISKAQIAAEAISTEKLAALSVTAGKIAVEAITAEKIAAGTITANKLAASSVTAEKLAAESVEATKIKALAITTEKLAVEAVTAAKIAVGAITAEKILAEAITALKIAAGAITTEKLAAGAVTAGKISVEELSAITAKAGIITAGTFRGTTFESTAGDLRINNSGLRMSQGEKEVHAIEWLKEVGGSLLAKLWAIRFTEEASMRSEISDSEKKLVRWETVAQGKSKQYSFLRAEVSETNSYVQAGAGTAETGGSLVTIWDRFEQSSFPRLGPGAAKRLMFFGACSAAGGILNGSGFTCTRTGVGRYTIKLTAALSTVGAIFVELNGSFTQVHKSSGPNKQEWQIQVNGFNFSIPALEAADEAFSFWVFQIG